jgi:tRNA (guanine-N7-)-methyltransferase
MKPKKEDVAIKFLSAQYQPLNRIIPLDRHQAVELDAGCGKGSFTTSLAKLHPERLILAADVMIGRLRKLQKRNEREHVNNIIPLRVELRHLIGVLLPDNSLDRMHLLCPDPWPKDRHRGNRLLCSNFMTHIHRVLKPGGQFHFSTDDDYYFNVVRKVTASSGLFIENNQLLEEIAAIKSDFEQLWDNLNKPVRHILLVNKK